MRYITFVVSFLLIVFAVSGCGERDASANNGEVSHPLIKEDSKITEKDVEYFTSSCIDYLNDQPSFEYYIKGVPKEEVLSVYWDIQDEVNGELKKHLGKKFPSSSIKYKWIVNKIEKVKKETVGLD